MHGSRDEQVALTSARPSWAVVIRSFAFLRKEVVEIVRQPRLVLLLVAGPFALLLLFGFGYGETVIAKRAVFVGPTDSVYAEVLAGYEDQLDDFIVSEGLVPSLAEARRMLRDGDVDVIVVFPEDAEETVMRGERAVIQVIHDEIDPIQQGAVEIAARLAIQEVNATVLTTLATDAESALVSAGDVSGQLAAAASSIDGDPVAGREAVRTELARLAPALDGTATILARLDVDDPAMLERLAATRQAAADLADRAGSIDETTTDAELEQYTADVESFAAQLDDTIVLDPAVLVRPFESSTESLSADDVSPTAYFTPASLALLLQHLALTFAALSLVRDRRTGLFELMRVGPLSSIEIVIGKIFAYLLVGTVVGAALVGASVAGLGVPVNGSILWVAVIVVGVLLASLSLGMVLAIVSGTESQAVQFAMLALLAGLFFSGFILPLDGLAYPVRVLSWLLPVTYGIEMLQDVMLRGIDPSPTAIVGLAALVAGYGVVAIGGLRRRLRIGEMG